MKDLVILASLCLPNENCFSVVSFLESRLFSTRYQTVGTGRLLTETANRYPKSDFIVGQMSEREARNENNISGLENCH